MAPDDVVEDVTDVLCLVESRNDGADGVGADLMPFLDQLDELVDDGTRSRHLLLGAVEREAVAAQRDGAAQPVTQCVQHTIGDARKLGGHLVRYDENVLHGPQSREDLPRRPGCTTTSLGELFADELGHDRAVGPP